MIRVKQRLGKYRIDRRIADGGYAAVFRAYDTIAGIPVALKVPHDGHVTKQSLEDFRKEVRLTARLDHPNILPIKDAGFIDGTFVIAYPLGEETLAERLQRRIAVRTMIQFAEQMLEAVAFAHQKRVMHCDIKPENLILFGGRKLRLADFGIARIAQRTMAASGSGTVGYIAPEQAMGKPSFRSDVFSLGLILYRMFAGQLPQWPYDWPPPGFDRLRRNLHPDTIHFLRRAMEVDHRKRFTDAAAMLAAFRRLKNRAVRRIPLGRSSRRRPTVQRDWRTVRRQTFLKQFRKTLETHGTCERCQGPVSEAMQACPWCGVTRKPAREEARFRQRCPRCRRSLKTDWRFCPWCYGPAINAGNLPRYGDVRYEARCSNPACPDGSLMPFMHYCPWCRRKVRKKWKIPGTNDRCPRCQWGVLPDYWDFCPWCTKALPKRQRARANGAK